MPSRRKERRSYVKIRLLFWNTSCCLSISYFYAGILDLTAWVKVSGSSHAKRTTSGFMEKKEILILFLSHWYRLFAMVKAAATILWDAPFVQGKWKVTVTGGGTWTCSPYSGKSCSPNEWALPCPEGMAEWCQHSPYCRTTALPANKEQSLWKAGSFYKEACPTARELTFGLTATHLIYGHPLLWWCLSVAVEEYLGFQAIYGNRNNLFLVSTHRPSICWTFGRESFHPNWIRH